MKKSVKAGLETESRFVGAAAKAEPARSKSYQRIAEGYSPSQKTSCKMNVEEPSDDSAERFRALDPKE